MDDQDVRKLERQNPILQVAIELGIKTHGSLGICFMSDRHSPEDDPMTLFFNTAKNSFFCKTCQDVGGSVVDLVCQCRGISRDEAVEWLAHRSEFDRVTWDRYHGKGWKKI